MTEKQEKSSEAIFSKSFDRNPYPIFKRLRQEDPIRKTMLPSGHYTWIVTTYKDAETILKDKRFIKDYTNLMEFEKEEDRYAHTSIFARNMLFADLPDHRRLRGLVQQAFTPKVIEELRPRIQEITDDLLDQVEQNGKMNLIDDFAFPLPIIVICEMLGVPSEDRDQFRMWSNTLIESTGDPEDTEKVMLHMQQFTQYLTDWVATRRHEPKEDLVSKLIHAEEEGDRLSEQELYGVIALLIMAGHETTVNLISNGVLALLNHPDQLEALRKDPSLIKPAIEEFLRFDGPVEFSTDRWAIETIEIGGQMIQKGDHVLVALNSANRDESVFNDPDLFDITRDSSKHLAFGKGIHFCLGAPLARLEAEIAVGTLLNRLTNLKLNVEEHKLIWRPSLIIRGLEELPITFEKVN
ncbi:cytochrome P450 family protein [Alkalicoccobacillus murimartini]|uniref:Cytochrome P450 n=1 Tax=Alkalicoccobacillus murimartini TaxID=171685 RepID=A0ABT9YMD8_9BACI|nr:cytochrome P450 [Alkalicoccobacillus murimartini]MDQ0208809.1 cytochrome P450 [Alkalicoccobacillus murimartini]